MSFEAETRSLYKYDHKLLNCFEWNNIKHYVHLRHLLYSQLCVPYDCLYNHRALIIHYVRLHNPQKPWDKINTIVDCQFPSRQGIVQLKKKTFLFGPIWTLLSDALFRRGRIEQLGPDELRKPFIRVLSDLDFHIYLKMNINCIFYISNTSSNICTWIRTSM